MLLYKYCGPGGIAILEHGSIFLTRPRGFNDPFDVSPYITKFEDPVELGDHVFRKIKDIVVLSLAENCDSLLMWAHYAASHTGFSIGFNKDEKILDRPTPLFHYFDAVSYCHHRATGKRFTDIQDYEIYFRKSSEWSYEKEWRLIETISAIDGDVEEAKSNWTFPLVTDSIKTVVVGHRGGWVLPKILKFLKEDPRYANVTLQFAVPDVQKYRLNLQEWKRELWDGAPPFELEVVIPPGEKRA